MEVNRTKMHGKYAEPSRADTAPKKMKATYSTNVTAQIK
jgi:hypothetical protein